MSIAKIAQTRYTTKVFDSSRKIPETAVEELLTVLRYAPSSVNSQPWHFIVAGTDEGKARIAKAMHGNFAYNESKVRQASHVVVFCVRRDLDDAHLERLLAQEEQDGRFATPEAKAGQNKSRSYYVGLHRTELKDAATWEEKQTYIALGTLLLSAATLEIDACPMEGFDNALLDEEFGLADQGLRSVVIASLGYRSADDFNAKLPKSRLPVETVITRI